MALPGVKINMGGKDRLFRFGYRAMKQTAVDMEVEVRELPNLLSDPTFGLFELMIYHGFRAGAMYAEEEVDFTKEDMEGWIDRDEDKLPLVLSEVAKQMRAMTEGPDGGKKKAVATAPPKSRPKK